jgi:hypothetical protein
MKSSKENKIYYLYLIKFIIMNVQLKRFFSSINVLKKDSNQALDLAKYAINFI